MDNLYASLESQYNLPQGALSAIQNAEGSKDTDVSPKGAVGRFQFMPETAQAYGVNPNDPVSSARGAAQYLADLTKQYGSFQAAIAHYNGGVKAGNAVANGQDAPYQETKKYLSNVNSNLQAPSDLQWQPIGGSESQAPSDLQWQPIQEKSQLQKHFEKKSAPELALLGVGKAVEDTLQGGKQLLDIPAQFLEKQFPAVAKFGKTLGMPTAEESAKQTQETINKERAYGEALMEHPSAVLGNLGGQLATAYLGGSALKGAGAVGAGEALMNPSTYKAAIGSGAALGALQPTIEGESKAFNTLAGGVAGGVGQGIVSGLSHLAQPIQEALSPVYQKAVDTLTKSGIPLDAAQKTGSTLLTRAKTLLDTNPLTAGFEQKSAAEQQAAFNKAVLKTVGVDANSATSDVMNKASTKISNTFENILSNNNVKLNDDIVNRISNIQMSASDAEKKPIVNLANRIIKNVDEKGEITGQNAYSIYKDLNRYASNGADSELAYQARQLRSTLLDGINGSLNDADKAALTQARGQFRNMKLLEGAIDKEGGGNISPSKLANVMGQKANRQASIYGRGDTELTNLAQAGNMLLKDKTPNSGTMIRAAAWLAPDLIGSIGYGAYTGDWKGAASAATTGAVAPYLIQKGMRSNAVQNYLEKGIQNVPIRSLLQAPENLGAQKLAPAALRSYLQTLPPEKR